MVQYEPKEIIVEFLRSRITDPQSRHTLTSDTFAGDDSTTEFTVTPTSGKRIQAVSSVTVDGNTKNKWDDYYIDLQNQKIIFKTAPADSTSVVVNYWEGTTSWVYPDKPREDLSSSSFPRISVMVVDSPGTRLGRYSADVEHNIHFQVDIWTKKDEGDGSNTFTINSRSYEGHSLANVLGHLVVNALKDNEDDVYPLLYDYEPVTGPRDLPEDVPHQAFHTIVEFNMKGINIGDDL